MDIKKLRCVIDCYAISLVLKDYAEMLDEHAPDVNVEMLKWLASVMERYSNWLSQIAEIIEIEMIGEEEKEEEKEEG